MLGECCVPTEYVLLGSTLIVHSSREEPPIDLKLAISQAISQAISWQSIEYNTSAQTQATEVHLTSVALESRIARSEFFKRVNIAPTAKHSSSSSSQHVISDPHSTDNGTTDSHPARILLLFMFQLKRSDVMS